MDFLILFAIVRRHPLPYLLTFSVVFYPAVVLGFALADSDNQLAACFCLWSMFGTGSTFLAFAVLAEKLKITTAARGIKSLYYVGGLAEGTETMIALFSMVLFPGYFVYIAVVFGVMCCVTTVSRILLAVEAVRKVSDS